ncbi:primosomal protein N' [uncultured Clostridium sp.]|uniref:primosomal protein N' n=1 Tax=uncultured Clostridium sp. TaxID=59620 RepID=UPI0026240CA6|nr:primosomal protein N' [uncultured Clostridium sp.]
MDLYADIIVNSDAVTIDKPFSYKVKDELRDSLKQGHRVRIPFGFGNKTIEGFVFNIYEEEKNDNIKYKYVVSICDKEPLLDREHLLLVEFLRRKYLCKYIDALRIMIPPKILSGNKEKFKKVVIFSKYIFDEVELKKEKSKVRKQIDALNVVKDNSGIYSKTELVNKFNISLSSLNKLIEKEAIAIEFEKVDRSDRREFEKYPAKRLTEAQEAAYYKILRSNKTCLLKGVTGSGKTEVYMNLVSAMLFEDKTSVMLVPEIALTPQMIERFKGRFGPDVAIFHSRLSDGERYDQWYRVKTGEAKLVIGARSALFLPFKDLGLIIVDEEHENSYKSEVAPRYSTVEVCNFMRGLNGCMVVLGTATPSLDSYYKTIKKEYELVELRERIGGKPLPTVEITDMREELRSGNKTMFSRALYHKIKEKLERKEQIILFLNRRGYSSFVSCRSCGFVYTCDCCDISMTYHKNGFMICHYCGRTKKISKTCPKCSSTYLKHFGTGTEKVEQAVRHYFKEARVIRMDNDTTRKKGSHEILYNKFKNQEADILVGTQMIAKGLDFENVTLVGVLAADMGINFPDYRAGERSFQLLTQVSGRAGRADKEGEVIIQTYTPDHYSLKYAKIADYESFFKEEIMIRKAMDYPPFSKLMIINLGSKFESELITFSKKLRAEVYNILKDETDTTVFEATQSIVAKINDTHRWQILIKGNINDYNAMLIKNGVYKLTQGVYNKIRVTMDINPNNLM